jgi:hypothetical protein
MLNPASHSPTHQELFEFFGLFLGFNIRSKSCMNWHFPPIFWKQLIGEQIGIHDLDTIDAYSYQTLMDIQKNAKERKPTEFDFIMEETS